MTTIGIEHGQAMRGTERHTTMVGEAGVVALLRKKVRLASPLTKDIRANVLGSMLGGRKRRRSLSPWERDRYDPRPRYGDDYGASNFYVPRVAFLTLFQMLILADMAIRLLIVVTHLPPMEARLVVRRQTRTHWIILLH